MYHLSHLIYKVLFPPTSSEVILTLLILPPSPVFVFSHLSIPRTVSWVFEFFLWKTKRSQIFILWHNVRIQSNPYCICQSTVGWLHDGLINSWLMSKNPYQQSIPDNELIFDNVVLINKESYSVPTYTESLRGEVYRFSPFYDVSADFKSQKFISQINQPEYH